MNCPTQSRHLLPDPCHLVQKEGPNLIPSLWQDQSHAGKSPNNPRPVYGHHHYRESEKHHMSYPYADRTSDVERHV